MTPTPASGEEQPTKVPPASETDSGPPSPPSETHPKKTEEEMNTTIDTVDLTREFISDDVLSMIPRNVAVARKAIPYSQNDRQVRVAVLDTSDHRFRRLLKKKFGRDVLFFTTTKDMLEAELKKYDTEFHERFSALETLAQNKRGGKRDESVIELTNALLAHGLAQRASDIHIEPGPQQTIVRERIDGLLRPSVSFSKDVHQHLIQRLKVMANLATDEHAMPQDGKLTYWTPERTRVDVRVSIVPVTHGEKTVLRLLPAQEQEMSLESLGCNGRNKELLEAQCKLSWGMVLVTGPTGSGKTTTLYTMLQKLNAPSVNISTIEDPVEYELAGTNQIQVNEKTGLTFAEGLRSLLRQDPNIILVGEIRDLETAGIAVNAAMTGHLVLSTLHTNNAATAIPRLLDMKIEPFLLASVVNIVVAQRLARKICEKCITWENISTADLERSLPPDIAKKLVSPEGKVRLAYGKGCDKCNGSGFLGRTGIFEVLMIDSAIRKLILRKETADTIQETALAGGMITMVDDGLDKIRNGVTTLEEFLRVIRS